MRAGVLWFLRQGRWPILSDRYTQIEKEVLVIIWICERPADYLVGLQFHIHTDHKPLIYFLSADKLLDAVPPHIQRFCLRMMRFSYSISYTLGTTLCTVGALSRFPLRDVSSSLPDIDALLLRPLLRCHYVMPSLTIFSQRQQQILSYRRCYVTVRQGGLTSKIIIGCITVCSFTWSPHWMWWLNHVWCAHRHTVCSMW